MSRSRKKSPAGWWCTDSSKQDKRWANRALRRKVKRELGKGNYSALPALREVSDQWSWTADGVGSFWYLKYEDPEWYAVLLRK